MYYFPESSLFEGVAVNERLAQYGRIGGLEPLNPFFVQSLAVGAYSSAVTLGYNERQMPVGTIFHDNALKTVRPIGDDFVIRVVCLVLKQRTMDEARLMVQRAGGKINQVQRVRVCSFFVFPFVAHQDIPIQIACPVKCHLVQYVRAKAVARIEETQVFAMSLSDAFVHSVIDAFIGF